MSKLERFLIYDEDQANLLFFEMLLKEMGMDEVFNSRNGEEALSLFEKENLGFGIVAWEVKTMAGTVFIQRIKKNRRRRYTPFLLYSKRMSENDVVLAKEYGIENILSMPFNRDKARELINEMINKEKNLSPEDKRIRQMESMIIDGKPGEALKLVDHVITKKGPHRPIVKTLIGEIWISFNKFDKAEKSLLEALNDDPENMNTKSLLAKVYSKTERHLEAMSILESMSQKSPKNMTHLFNLGNAYLDGGENQKAKAVFTKVKDMDEDNKQVNGELGKIAFTEGNFDLATQLFAESDNGQEIARYLNNLGINQIQKNNFEEGIKSYLNALSVLKDETLLPLLEYNLALAYRKKGDLVASFNALAQCYLKNAKYEKAYVTLGRVVGELRSKNISFDKGIVGKIKEVRNKLKNDSEVYAQQVEDQSA